MAELKHNFVKGRMNKDFDERLVPNGEYRDALNIEVSTSEDSDVGSVQNIKGNLLVSNVDHNFGTSFMTDTAGQNRNAVSVGCYSDESSKKIFNFIHKASDLIEDGTFNGLIRFTGVRSDVITEYTATSAAEQGVTYPLVVDTYEARHTPEAQTSLNTFTITDTAVVDFSNNAQVQNSNQRFAPRGVREGMKVRMLTTSGVDLYGATDDVRVTAVNYNPFSQSITINITTPASGVMYDASQLAAGTVIQFLGDRILNFKNGVQEIEQNVTNTPTSYTPQNNIVTAINYADGILFYTDGRNEPKRIVTDRFKFPGGSYDIQARVDMHSFFRYKVPTSGNTRIFLFEEDQITVIRKSPRIQPNIEAKRTKRPSADIDGLFDGNGSQQVYDSVVNSLVSEVNTSTGSLGGFALVEYTSGNVQVMTPGSIINVKAANAFVNWKSGDQLEITGLTTSATARVDIISADTSAMPQSNSATGLGNFQLAIVDVDEGYGVQIDDTASAIDNQDDGNIPPEEVWQAVLIEKKSLYPDSFLFFSTRYKYIDNEYSSIGPYTKGIFLPSWYSYNATTGFNNGMENQLRYLKVSDYISVDIPKDVIEVEILFKISGDANAYIAETVKLGSTQWSSTSYSNAYLPFANTIQEVLIEDSVFGAALPEDQLVRVFDQVPINAKSQEISSSRLIYGNYQQTYDITDSSNSQVNTNIESSIQTYQTVFTENLPMSNNATATSTQQHALPELVAGANPNSGLTNFPGVGYAVNGATPANGQDGQRYAMYGVFVLANENDDNNLLDQYDHPSSTGLNSNIPSVGNHGVPTYASLLQGETSTLAAGENRNDISLSFGAAFVPPSNFTQYKVNPDFATNPVFQGLPQYHIAEFSLTEFNIVVDLNQFSTSGGSPTGSNGNWKMKTKTILHWRKKPTSPTTSVSIDNAGGNYSAVIISNDTLGQAPTSLFEINYNEPKSAQNTITFSGDLAGGERIFPVLEVRFEFEELSGSAMGSWDGNWPGVESFDIFIPPGSPTMEVQSPDVPEELITVLPKESVKSLNTYQLGVVYGDKYGRESNVLVHNSGKLTINKNKSVVANKIFGRIKHNPPSWAEYYKYFVKEVSSEFYNIVMHRAYPNGTTAADFANFSQQDIQAITMAWLSFNSNDKDKVTESDFLVLKKQHGDNTPVTNENARFKILSIVATPAELLDAGGPDLTNNEDAAGKFFVKIKADSNFDDFIATYDTISNLSNVNSENAVLNGAVFEVQRENKIDQELFYEASQGYPIKLTTSNVTDYIKPGMRVAIEDGGDVFNAFINYGFKVDQVYGAVNFPKDTMQATALSQSLVQVSLTPNTSTTITDVIESITNPAGFPLYPATTFLAVGRRVRFINDDGSFVSLHLVKSDGLYSLELSPYTHTGFAAVASPSFSNKNHQGIPWFNCIAFGNGVESDRVRDDFNTNVIYPYTSVGRQSGFKVNLPIVDFKKEVKKYDLIFSQIYNESANVARYNEFIIAHPKGAITKKLNSEYGSIQKLHARDGDLIAFCESKVLKILANKDALFNADGNADLLSSTNVLGQAIPFVGDYGISTNPESFAAEEYRIYFADKNRGAICRLSRDGITAISNSGMKNFFNDNLETASAVIGSYDGKKNEYNVTMHCSTNPDFKKNVFTLGFSENVKGWTSFKSFIKESGLSMNNEYYTFKNGDMYLHHPDLTTTLYNNFYGTQYDSKVTTIFNEDHGSVKLFKVLNYEGTQSREL